jgi:nanoRNase/pAp phosphatase (c-di-AMP/oligoRNAs hydrolase)
MDQNPRQQALQRITGATNVLVTVSRNPSVDQLAAAIGFTLLLNKMGKHGTAVFSGEVPSTIEFLKPSETIEKNTDSLRDFIIALDKSKADKLRYKVEDTYVKIFITPYKTTLGADDLEFSQGDFNVDVVVAIGVRSREELDDAITAHGRILHDAAVIAVNNKEQGNLGAINWNDPDSSSLCEMLVGLSDALSPNTIDAQMATSFLTGIVAETGRFSNQRTTAKTMTISAELIAAGANQQLVASKLDEDEPEEVELPKVQAAPPKPATNGTLEIDHHETKVEPPKKEAPPIVDPDQIHIDDKGTLHYTKDLQKAKEEAAQGDDSPQGTDMTHIVNGKLMSDAPAVAAVPADAANIPAIDQPFLSYSAAPQGQTLSELEQSAKASVSESADEAAEAVSPPPVGDARDAVDDAIKSAPPTGPLPPVEALGANHVDLDAPTEEEATSDPLTGVTPPTGTAQDSQDDQTDEGDKSDSTTTSTAPPPVPPPMMPPFTPSQSPSSSSFNSGAPL